MSKSSSGMRALAMAVVSTKVGGYRIMVAQTRCQRVFVRACQLPVPRGDLQVQDRTGVRQRILLTHLYCRSYRACRVDAMPILVTTEGRRWSGR